MKKLLFLLIYFVFYIVSFSTAQQTTSFMVLSDTHISSPSSNFQETIFYELMLAAIDEQIDFIFITGDLVIGSFSDAAEKDSVLKDWRFVLDTLDQHNIGFYACRGNNDRSKEAWDSLFTGKYVFPQNGPENEKNITYALEYDNTLFLSLDQYSDSQHRAQTWLDSILNKNQKTHIFVAGHEPAFKLSHNSYMGTYPAARDSMWESLLKAGAKIYFSGHDHFYDHTIIDDTDENPDNDMHQIIVGTAPSYFHSDSEYNGDNGRWTPVRLFHEEANGYVLVEVSENEVQTTWKRRSEPGVFVDGGDNYTFTVTAIDKTTKSAPAFSLQQTSPNPFNPKTMINYQLSMNSEVDLSIYNLQGQKVATLVSKKQAVGSYSVQWDASAFTSGIYYYHLKAGDFEEVKKMILIK